jgi:hypothetical protein
MISRQFPSGRIPLDDATELRHQMLREYLSRPLFQLLPFLSNMEHSSTPPAWVEVQLSLTDRADRRI